VDSDGDGLPDAWEIAMGLNPNDPNDAGRDSDGDGLSNEEEYRAGTYAFDPNDGFRLSLVGADAGQSQLEFLVIPGRTYTVYSSSDFQQWTPVSFRVVSGGVTGALQGNYSATAVRQLRIDVPPQAGTTNRYFKAMVN
jgi:hypothetical protein